MHNSLCEPVQAALSTRAAYRRTSPLRAFCICKAGNGGSQLKQAAECVGVDDLPVLILHINHVGTGPAASLPKGAVRSKPSAVGRAGRWRRWAPSQVLCARAGFCRTVPSAVHHGLGERAPKPSSDILMAPSGFTFDPAGRCQQTCVAGDGPPNRANNRTREKMAFRSKRLRGHWRTVQKSQAMRKPAEGRKQCKLDAVGQGVCSGQDSNNIGCRRCQGKRSRAQADN